MSTQIRIRPLLLAVTLLTVLAAPFAVAQREQVIYNIASVENLGATKPISDAAGNIYGAIYSLQTIYEISPPTDGSTAWTYTALAQAPGYPTSLAIDENGNLFGTTSNGGGGTGCTEGCGTVFEISPPAQSGGDWTLATIYQFQHAAHNGNIPYPLGITVGPNGVLYGAAADGGTLGYGAIFRLQPPSKQGRAWTYNVLYQFRGGADGQVPTGYFGIDSNLNLYGTTQYGGTGTSCFQDCGTAFELSPSTSGEWTKTILFDFPDIGIPNPGLILDNSGNLYGSLYSSDGEVFELSPPAQSGQPWTETVVHLFSGKPDGQVPLGVAMGPGNILYGATFYGGVYNQGTVFQLKPPAESGGDWTESILYNFGKSSADGYNPDTNVLLMSGKIFGETFSGGTAECNSGSTCGVVYEVTP